jgi:hypothetical protein
MKLKVIGHAILQLSIVQLKSLVWEFENVRRHIGILTKKVLTRSSLPA